MAQVHGYEVTDIAHGPDSGEPSVSINLNDQIVVLTKADADRLAAEAQNGDEYKAAVLEQDAANAKAWEKESSPKSKRGQDMEAGTPQQADHGGDRV